METRRSRTAPSAADIEGALGRIAAYVRRTPVLRVEPEATGLRVPVWLKLESLQSTGSFKVRNAFALLLGAAVPDAGVVAASGGNFGLALAHAAGRLGHAATIFVPGTTPGVKVERIRAQDATVEIVPGPPAAALYDASRRRAEETGALLAHPFDQREGVAGAGTCGLELDEQCPALDTVLVPVGGGGLIGGIATWFGERARVVAVETHGTACLHRSRQAGARVEVAPSGVAMSALGAPLVGELGWIAAQRHVDDSVLVSDEDVGAARRLLWEAARIVAEPGAVVGLAALVAGAYRPGLDEGVAVVISGGNVAPGEP